MSKTLLETLADCATEEDVKFSFLKFFALKPDSRKHVDFYSRQILFEFKLGGEFSNIQRRARAFAQSIYYIRRMILDTDDRTPSENLAVVDKISAAIIPTEPLVRYCRDRNFDWDLAPSTPCKKLIAALAADPIVRDCRVFDFRIDIDAEHFSDLIRKKMLNIDQSVRVPKEINENNFYSVFEEWNREFGAYVANSHKPSEYFLTDIERGRSCVIDDAKTVLFRLHDGQTIEKRMPIDYYKPFWSKHEKVSDARTMLVIRQRMDRMTTIELRRFTGEFFTPIEHARKALEYLARVLGERWWESGEYRLWDPAAGTGNLEFSLPNEALKYCYISTLLSDDAAYCKKIYPEATVFQYDYLNDSEDKLPPNLRADFDNPDLKWIVFINPPYATSSNFENYGEKVKKYGVSFTAVQKDMKTDGLGEVSRELFNQFLYRINRQFRDRQAFLGMFSKLKYINAYNDDLLRNKFFDYEFAGGFIFSSNQFSDTKGKFPVGFAMWNLARHIPLIDQTIEFDVFNDRLEKIAIKKITSTSRGEFLNDWIKRPPCRKRFPPLSSAINLGKHGNDRRDRIADGFLASFMCASNDFMHQNKTALLSAPYVSGGAFSIVPENFEQSMIVHTVRRLPKATWLNDKDQFLQPTRELPVEFVNDCVVWSLFSGSNCTAAIADVEYEGNRYRIKNNFYPWRLDEILDWECAEPALLYSAVKDTDRFAAQWLSTHELSSEASSVLDAARSIWQTFYARLNELDREKYRLETWDVGWYQVRRSLEDANLLDNETFRAEFDRLGEKLLPQIYSLGFLRDEVIYFD